MYFSCGWLFSSTQYICEIHAYYYVDHSFLLLYDILFHEYISYLSISLFIDIWAVTSYAITNSTAVSILAHVFFFFSHVELLDHGVNICSTLWILLISLPKWGYQFALLPILVSLYSSEFLVLSVFKFLTILECV